MCIVSTKNIWELNIKKKIHIKKKEVSFIKWWTIWYVPIEEVWRIASHSSFGLRNEILLEDFSYVFCCLLAPSLVLSIFLSFCLVQRSLLLLPLLLLLLHLMNALIHFHRIFVYKYYRNVHWIFRFTLISLFHSKFHALEHRYGSIVCFDIVLMLCMLRCCCLFAWRSSFNWRPAFNSHSSI